MFNECGFGDSREGFDADEVLRVASIPSKDWGEREYAAIEGLKQASKRMSLGELRERDVSFVYGNLVVGSCDVTREMVRSLYDERLFGIS